MYNVDGSLERIDPTVPPYELAKEILKFYIYTVFQNFNAERPLHVEISDIPTEYLKVKVRIEFEKIPEQFLLINEILCSYRDISFDIIEFDFYEVKIKEEYFYKELKF